MLPVVVLFCCCFLINNFSSCFFFFFKLIFMVVMTQIMLHGGTLRLYQTYCHLSTTTSFTVFRLAKHTTNFVDLRYFGRSGAKIVYLRVVNTAEADVQRVEFSNVISPYERNKIREGKKEKIKLKLDVIDVSSGKKRPFYIECWITGAGKLSFNAFVSIEIGTGMQENLGISFNVQSKQNVDAICLVLEKRYKVRHMLCGLDHLGIVFLRVCVCASMFVCVCVTSWCRVNEIGWLPADSRCSQWSARYFQIIVGFVGNLENSADFWDRWDVIVIWVRSGVLYFISMHVYSLHNSSLD